VKLSTVASQGHVGDDDDRYSQICCDLQDPVWLNQNDGANVEDAAPSRKKWLVLDPGDDVVKCPGSVQQDGRRAQVPIVDWRFDEHESAVKHAKEELDDSQPGCSSARQLTV
jgi:hypothetical protein